MVDVCVCSCNPDYRRLSNVLGTIFNQSARRLIDSVLIVDNGSSPRLPVAFIDEYQHLDIPSRIVVELTPGVIHARIRAMNETTGGWLLFVDDDNELSYDYIERSIEFIEANPDVGCFGGKLLLPESVRPPQWFLPFLPFLGIRNEGDQVIKNISDSYGSWEPPTAGAWIHRRVVDEFLRRVTLQPDLLRLGRSGTNGLASCEDSLIMRGASAVGLLNAYVPQLALWHHLDKRKFRIRFVLKLMLGFGGSHVLLESCLAGVTKYERCYTSRIRTLLLMKMSFIRNYRKSFLYALGAALYHYGAYKEYSRLTRKIS